MNYFLNKNASIALIALIMICSIFSIEKSAFAFPKNSIVSQEYTPETNTDLKEGQFVNDGFEGNLKIEILAVKRIPNSETQEISDIVAVKLRVKRVEESSFIPGIIKMADSKGRNVDTFEEYRTVNNKYSQTTAIQNIPADVWGELYFWLNVPKGINVIDIVIPNTEIFRNVPIDS